MNMDTLKRQHREILRQVQEIERLLTAEYVTDQAFDISLKIGYLSGIIKTHLKTEDEFLYPALGRSQDRQVVERAAEFFKEMGGIAHEFGRFRDDFNTASKIKASPQEFIKRCREIFAVLGQRIDKEEKHLYPLLK